MKKFIERVSERRREGERDELICLDMHLLIDVPLISDDKMKWNQCLAKKEEEEELNCVYWKYYERIGLDFGNRSNVDQSLRLINKWLNENHLDGVRVHLPLETKKKKISFSTIIEWNKLIENISKKGKTK